MFPPLLPFPMWGIRNAGHPSYRCVSKDGEMVVGGLKVEWKRVMSVT